MEPLISTFTQTYNSGSAKVEEYLKAVAGKGRGPMKQMDRVFKLSEAAEMLHTPKTRINQRIKELGIVVEKKNGFRVLTLAQINILRDDIHGTYKRQRCVIAAILSGKGGDGKSGFAVHMAFKLALLGRKVLFIDLDSQGTGTAKITGNNPDVSFEANDTVAAFMMGSVGSLKEIIKETGIPRLSLAPCCQRSAIMNIAGAMGTNTTNELYESFFRLQDGISEIESEYDVIVIDTQPTVTFTNLRALLACNMIIHPICPRPESFLSSTGFEGVMLDYLTDIKNNAPHRTYNDVLRKYLISRYDTNPTTNKPHVELSSIIRSAYPTYGSEYAELKEISNAAHRNKTIFELDKGIYSSTTRSKAIQSLENVFSEVLDDIEIVGNGGTSKTIQGLISDGATASDMNAEELVYG